MSANAGWMLKSEHTVAWLIGYQPHKQQSKKWYHSTRYSGKGKSMHTMRPLVRNRITREYLAPVGGWTQEERLAASFDGLNESFRQCRGLKLKGMEYLLRSGSGNHIGTLIPDGASSLCAISQGASVT
jgi:hypothetical protein